MTNSLSARKKDNLAVQVGLPVKTFLYTLDQIAGMLNMRQDDVMQQYIHFDNRSLGAPPSKAMRARNIARDEDTPDWRVTEGEFIRWLRLMKIRVYEHGGAV